MASTIKNAVRMALQLSAEDLAPSSTGRGPGFPLNPRIGSIASAPRRGGRTANQAELRQLREPNLSQRDRASRHVRNTGQISTTAATDRGAAQQTLPSPSPPPSSPTEASPPDEPRTTPSSGWNIAVLWRVARRIDLQAVADENPTGFMGVLIQLAALIVGVVALLWAIIQGVTALVLQARSNSTEGAMHQPRRRIEAAWENLRRRADNFARSLGLSLPARPLGRMHARQWDGPGQEMKVKR